MKCFSLFSGIGGFDLAMKLCGHEITGACEIDRYARWIYEQNFQDVKVWHDARKIKPKELPDFDICARDSLVRLSQLRANGSALKSLEARFFMKLLGLQNRNDLGSFSLKTLRDFCHTKKGEHTGFILSELHELGYNAEWANINSKRYVPQNRERLYIICTPRDQREPKIFPLPENDKTNNEKRPIVRTLTGGGHSGGLHST